MYIQHLNSVLAVTDITDVYKSIIWNNAYFEPGDFQIVIPAKKANVEKIIENPFIMISEDTDNVGIIESHSYYAASAELTLSGRFAKSLLDRRLIVDTSESLITGENRITLSPVIIGGSGTTLESEVRGLVNRHISTGASGVAPRRRINLIVLGELKGYTQMITDTSGNVAERQTTYSNLLTYTDELLKEFGYGAVLKLIVSGGTRRLGYEVICGANRSWTNTDGNSPVIFGLNFDNMSEFKRSYNSRNLKNVYIAGGSGEGAERFFVSGGFSDGASGIDRREVFIDAVDQSLTYWDGDTEHTYSDTEYATMVRQSANAEMIEDYAVTDEFEAKILLSEQNFKLRRDFRVGDIVTAIDPVTSERADVRITKVTEVWDGAGYSAYATIEK